MTARDASAVAVGPEAWDAEGPVRVGVSSCLLGEPVRFDAGHKRDRFVTDALARFVELVPVCPEVEVGMGTPRPALRLVDEAGRVRMREVKSGRDHTAAMRCFARRRVRELARQELCGYVLKKDSPSCGAFRVKLYREQGGATRAGRGLFAEALIAGLPELPVEDEGRLNDARLRENFVERVFAYHRLRGFLAGRWTRGGLVAFHTAHKLQLLAHSQAAYRALGRLVAEARAHAPAALRDRYRSAFMEALARPATPGRHANVLQHMAGHLRGRLDDASRAELAEVIHEYRREQLPLVVPMTLLRHHARRLEVDYLLGQTYLQPHPRELMLRNHV